MPSKQTTAASMESVITLRDPSIVAARMDLAEMASIAMVITLSRKKYYAQGVGGFSGGGLNSTGNYELVLINF